MEYGESHYQAKKEKKKRMSHGNCEETGETRNIQYHHEVPRMFNGVDHHSNYTQYVAWFHQKVHHTCNIREYSSLITQRLQLTRIIEKNLCDDKKRDHAHQQLEDIDNLLITEYVNNMVDGLIDEHREAIKRTLASNFKTIRDLTIENRVLTAKMKYLEDHIG